MGRSWHPETLNDFGLTQSESLQLAPLINDILAIPDPVQAWQLLCDQVLHPDLPFELHLALYEALSERRAKEDGPLPIWFPREADVKGAHVSALMLDLGFSKYAQLHRWSVENRMAFWSRTIAQLGIKFHREPVALAAKTDQPWQPQWLPGARLNIADSCFQAEAEAAAIVWQAHDQAPLETFSYADLAHWSGRVANGLIKAGFAKGDAIAIDMVMNPASVAIYLGILRAGCVVISIADSFSAQEIATRLRIGGAKGIFTMDVILRGGKRLPMYEKVVAAAAPKAMVLPAGESLVLPLRDGDLAWSDFLANEGQFDSEMGAAADLINILFSSGTTGDPKAIGWDHTTPLKAASDGYYHHDIHVGDVVAWPTNLGWMMGPWLIFATLINRGTIALYGDAPTSSAFCRFVQDAGVNLLGVVPSLVKAWRHSHAVEGLDWRGIRTFSSTGECSNGEDMHYLMALAGYRPVIEYCGGTEIGGGYFCGTVIQPAVPAAFTTPTLGLDMVILDEAGNPADAGELFLVPPSMGLSRTLLNRDHEAVYYRGVPELADGRKLRRHGDQFFRLPGGYYRAEGRADDTMNLGGIKVGSAEIERILKTIAGVDETAAVAIAPASGGPSQLVVFAVLNMPLDPATIRVQMQQAIRQHLNPLFKINDLRVLNSLPRTASGKVMRRVLRAQYKLA